MKPRTSRFKGALRTHRGCLTIYWMFHPSCGMMGWMFTDTKTDRTLLQWIVPN